MRVNNKWHALKLAHIIERWPATLVWCSSSDKKSFCDVRSIPKNISLTYGFYATCGARPSNEKSWPTTVALIVTRLTSPSLLNMALSIIELDTDPIHQMRFTKDSLWVNLYLKYSSTPLTLLLLQVWYKRIGIILDLLSSQFAKTE